EDAAGRVGHRRPVDMQVRATARLEVVDLYYVVAGGDLDVLERPGDRGRLQLETVDVDLHGVVAGPVELVGAGTEVDELSPARREVGRPRGGRAAGHADAGERVGDEVEVERVSGAVVPR